MADRTDAVCIVHEQGGSAARRVWGETRAGWARTRSDTNTGQLVFALIEPWLPDPIRANRDWRPYGAWVRSATAGIIIALPIFLFLSRWIGREVARGSRRARWSP